MQQVDYTTQDVTPATWVRGTVLIADDAAHTRGLYAMLLEARGLHVHEAEDADRVVDLYRLHRPDLVLLNVTTAGGGLAVLAAIKQFDPDARVIVVTALRDTAVLTQAVAAGIVDYLVKPFGRDRLITAVERFVG